MAKLHLIYVPGLGDRRVRGQQLLVTTWKWWSVSAELCQMNWADNESWEPKFARLLARIDAAVNRGHTVGLIGASAGATAVINAFQARQQAVCGVVLIAGKVNYPERISPRLLRQNKAFGNAAIAAADVIHELDDRALSQILSRRAVLDVVVPAADSLIPGARNQVVPTFGHATTIATQLFSGAPSFIHFLRKRATTLNS